MILALLSVSWCSAAAERSRSAVFQAMTSHPSSGASVVGPTLRGGAVGEPSDELLQATFACNRLYGHVLEEASAELLDLRDSVFGGEPVSDFGAKADALLTNAADTFSASAPASSDFEAAALYTAKAEELQSVLITKIEPVFTKQIALLKEASLEQFKRGLAGDVADGAEALLLGAESTFVREAKLSIPSQSNWNTKVERASLVGVMRAIQAQLRKTATVRQEMQRQTSSAMQFLQMQQQQMQQLQAQFSGGQGNKWNFGGAYRPPDTDINLSGTYQQGRGHVQVSMVPDDGAALLGQNGFTQGVGPGNLGLSFNFHV